MLNAHTQYEVFEHEHRVLRAGIETLRRALAEENPGNKAELLKHLEAVQAQLADHFAFEESFGFKRHLRLMESALDPTLDRLLAAHREILASLASASSGLRTGWPWPAVRSTVLSTLEALADHELDEHQLLHVVWRRSRLPPTA